MRLIPCIKEVTNSTVDFTHIRTGPAADVSYMYICIIELEDKTHSYSVYSTSNSIEHTYTCIDYTYSIYTCICIYSIHKHV